MDKQPAATKISRPKPKDFLRSRRPEQFSDSVKLHESAIDRSVLEYHFETLNNRSQELQFETFVRKLCEQEICPNLVPQTGPTAGGDGKTDTETYPVSNQIAFFWGLNDAPEAERWAFGVSTQKAWKAKCVKDVESIMSTGRGYLRIFCVSSRYIKNSSRVELQDELSEKHGVKVTILDRTWLESLRNGLRRKSARVFPRQAGIRMSCAHARHVRLSIHSGRTSNLVFSRCQ